MADIEKNVVLDFQTNLQKVTQEMSDLRQQMSMVSREQKKLNEDFKNGAITEDQYTKGMLASEMQMKDYQRQMKVLSATSFKELGVAFKEGVLGARNLGEAFVNAGRVSSQALKMLFANPLGIVITLATGLVSAIGKIVSKNDTLATSFGKLKDSVTIPFRLLLQLLDPIAKGIGFVVDKITTFVGKISTMGRELNTITDLTEKLEDAQNQYNLAASATAITLNNLKTIYDDSTKPIEDRIAALEEAKDAELALAKMQNNLNHMELERAVLEAKNDQKWKAHQKAAFDLIKYDPTKTVEKNIENFEWQMGKLGDLDQDLKDKIYTTFTNYVTSQNAISKINAEFVRKQSSLIKQETKNISEDTKTTDDIAIQNAEKAENIRNEIRQLEIERMEEGVEKKKALVEEEAKHYLEQLKIRLRKGEITQEEYDKLAELQEKKKNKSLSDIQKAADEQRQKDREAIIKKYDSIRDKSYDSEIENENARYNSALDELKKYLDKQIITQEDYDRLSEILAKEHQQNLTKINNNETAKRLRETQKNLNQTKDMLSKTADKIESLFEQGRFIGGIDELTEYREKIQENINDITDKINKLKDAGVDVPYFLQEALAKFTENLKLTDDVWVNGTQRFVGHLTSIMDSASTVVGAFADYYGAKADEILSKNETLTQSQAEQAYDAAESQYHATKAGIVLNTTAALGNAVAAALDVFKNTPGGLVAKIASLTAALATGTAAVVSGMTQAKAASSTYEQLKAQIKEKRGYATGGYIEGAGTSTSDSIPARLSNGEAVINAKSTSMYYDLLSRINQAGGGVAFPNAQNSPILRFASGGVATNTAQIVEAVKQAVSGIQPVVSVKEITRAQNKLKAKEI